MRTPYFEVSVWGGRLPVPVEYRGTVLAKQFESGRIGGKKVTARRSFADNPNERRALQAFVRRHDPVDIVYVRDSRVRPRQNLTRAQVLHRRFLTETL